MTALLSTPEQRVRVRRRWRPGLFTVLFAVFAVIGASLGFYPSAASWVSSVNQAQVINDWSSELDNITPDASAQLSAAHEYNQTLNSSAVLAAGANVPTSTAASSDDALDYDSLLTADDSES